MGTRKLKGIPAMKTYKRLSAAQVFHLKMPFGERVGARSSEEQAARLIVRCEAFPRMTQL